MKEIKKNKFTLEKFEIAKLKNAITIIGGTGIGGPETGTQTSDRCSKTPDCKNQKPQPPGPQEPTPPPIG